MGGQDSKTSKWCGILAREDAAAEDAAVSNEYASSTASESSEGRLTDNHPSMELSSSDITLSPDKESGFTGGDAEFKENFLGSCCFGGVHSSTKDC